MENTKISIDFVVGISIATFFVIVAGVLIYFGRRVIKDKHDRELLEPSDGKIFVGGGLLVLLVTIGIFIVATWPLFDMEYHSYKLVNGQVAESQSRLLAEGKGTTQNFAVMLAGTNDIYRCDDTRCSLLKPGDHIWMWCIREWQQAATPGYVCNYDHVIKGEGS